jgi:hypothetical protein
MHSQVALLWNYRQGTFLVQSIEEAINLMVCIQGKLVSSPDAQSNESISLLLTNERASPSFNVWLSNIDKEREERNKRRSGVTAEIT